MKLMELLRTQQGRSKAALARDARLAPIQITWAADGRFKLYPVQLKRLADALYWTGDPEDLLKEVPTDDAAS